MTALLYCYRANISRNQIQSFTQRLEINKILRMVIGYVNSQISGAKKQTQEQK